MKFLLKFENKYKIEITNKRDMIFLDFVNPFFYLLSVLWLNGFDDIDNNFKLNSGWRSFPNKQFWVRIPRLTNVDRLFK